MVKENKKGEVGFRFDTKEVLNLKNYKFNKSDKN